ncbi:MAG: hypothetical protein HYY64_17375 [Candidatus Rokubacteria bacterium]|nr:hypothetical protein [Candidatus Rokubacteria bacterium]
MRRVKYVSLRQLLRHELVSEEDAGTQALIRRLRHVKRAREFSRHEFLAMCRWKSPRAMGKCRGNSAATIRRVSRAALAARSERTRMSLLTSLHGVGLPMASAILTLIDPRRYGVLDIRVWQLLFAMDSVRTNPRGVGFDLGNWYQYLRRLRDHARAMGVSARTVERTLFEYHRKVQQGRLYEWPRRGIV